MRVRRAAIAGQDVGGLDPGGRHRPVRAGPAGLKPETGEGLVFPNDAPNGQIFPAMLDGGKTLTGRIDARPGCPPRMEAGSRNK